VGNSRKNVDDFGESVSGSVSSKPYESVSSKPLPLVGKDGGEIAEPNRRTKAKPYHQIPSPEKFISQWFGQF